jgi:quinol monooxygenase YgiN
VKPGAAFEFVSARTEFAEWTSQDIRGAGCAALLGDTADPGRFVAFGPWESLAAIESWRGADGWQARVARIRELRERFEPATLELVAEVG